MSTLEQFTLAAGAGPARLRELGFSPVNGTALWKHPNGRWATIAGHPLDHVAIGTDRMVYPSSAAPERIGDRNRPCAPLPARRTVELGLNLFTYSAHWLDFWWQAAEVDTVEHQAGWWHAGNMHGTAIL